MAKPRIEIEVIDRKGKYGCHRGHQIGQVFDFDQDRGKICPMALHSIFPHIDILRYGGNIPLSQEYGVVAACCPDPDVVMVYKLTQVYDD